VDGWNKSVYNLSFTFDVVGHLSHHDGIASRRLGTLDPPTPKADADQDHLGSICAIWGAQKQELLMAQINTVRIRRSLNGRRGNRLGTCPHWHALTKFGTLTHVAIVLSLSNLQPLCCRVHNSFFTLQNGIGYFDCHCCLPCNHRHDGSSAPGPTTERQRETSRSEDESFCQMF
jgi:hypothetical protein